MNKRGEQYDANDALKRFLIANRSSSPEAFVRGLLADVASFTDSAPQSDDMTAMYLKRS
jgi:serine phosphatase RsbU (regulator of sigma subunit)